LDELKQQQKKKNQIKCLFERQAKSECGIEKVPCNRKEARERKREKERKKQ